MLQLIPNRERTRNNFGKSSAEQRHENNHPRETSYKKWSTTALVIFHPSKQRMDVVLIILVIFRMLFFLFTPFSALLFLLQLEMPSIFATMVQTSAALEWPSTPYLRNRILCVWIAGCLKYKLLETHTKSINWVSNELNKYHVVGLTWSVKRRSISQLSTQPWWPAHRNIILFLVSYAKIAFSHHK